MLCLHEDSRFYFFIFVLDIGIVVVIHWGQKVIRKGFIIMASSFYRTVLNYFGLKKNKTIVLQEQPQNIEEIKSVSNIQWDSSKERLTDDKMHDYLGVNYEGVMYYNFDNLVWKSDKCLGFCMPYQDKFEKLMWNLKSVLEQEPRFAKYELAAAVTMIVKDRFFPGVGMRVTHPFFARGGTGVVGTIICRDKQTGKLLPMPCNWNGVDVSKLGTCNAIWYGPKWFALAGIENTDFRKSLLKNHCRTR